MEIIQNFGINPYLLVAQIVNFLILFYLLQRFAFKPILKTLRERKLVIQESLENAEESKKVLDKALVEEKKLLKKAQSEAQQILADAKSQAQISLDETKRDAKKQVETLLLDAHEQISRDARETEKKIALQSARLAVNMVQDAITGVFTEKEQSEALKKLTQNLEKVKNP